MHTLNIIVGKTNTHTAQLIRRILGGKYNHCSITLDNDYTYLYSFSRRFKRFWFTGCFTKETLDIYSDYTVFDIEITDEEYKQIIDYLKLLHRHLRIYNYLAAFFIIWQVPIPFRYSFICSTFVASVLAQIDGVELDKDFHLYSPMNLYEYLLSEDISHKDFSQFLSC